MSRNGDIRGFFGKPSGRSSTQSLPVASSSPPVLDPQSSISTPRTPKSTPKPRDRTDEIKGSDDEDGDSDGSLESITAFIERKHGPSPYQRDTNLTSPKAKRIATASTSYPKSPLTIQPKHKFDLKYLIDHARQSDRAEESARKADELINQSEDDEDEFGQLLTEVQNDPSLLQKTAKELLDNDEEDTRGDKLMRAMNRTKVDGSRRVCYFFNLEQPLLKPPRKPFPQKRATGAWRCLADSSTRDQSVIFGYPHSIVDRGGKIPDEIFLWILDELCVEKNAQLRSQYVNLLVWCLDSIPRLVTTARLYYMLEKLGGPKYSQKQDHSKLQSFPRVEDPYPQRDWSGLVTFLILLDRMARSMSTESVIGAIKLLLRMALDPLVSTTVRPEHAEAMGSLVEALPKHGTNEWDEACETISLYFYEIVDGPGNHVIPISYMPNTGTKQLDLRRRMAAVAFFQDTSLGRKPVDEALTLDALTDRLESPDFRISQTTDFEALRALVTLLDIVLGSGGFIMKQYTSSATNANVNAGSDTQDGVEDRDAGRKFDADIDGLTFRLKIIHDKIHDSTLLSRKVAKASIDLVAKRLTYAVRTRPPPKTSIFDPEPKEDRNLPKQRAFMKSWAQKKAAKSADSLANGNGGSGG
ncbi:uncharacterized protein F4807DRAFT_457386 [Annulohypoxylon truncatum]|uniref:uncharacterized protein n=1 Tax=Annulohypoxylon truncatum TaxID=327061 RepID=UPI002007CDCF|nr:uncharacterized protein F4807DRAFT_457386 [Annulohypoxylon truncatum]KAI1212588.1 hypothetical protein F4807DRAFT_457386 [Annulohypoxylon truncatum]